jgi:hypothetical protein
VKFSRKGHLDIMSNTKRAAAPRVIFVRHGYVLLDQCDLVSYITAGDSGFITFMNWSNWIPCDFCCMAESVFGITFPLCDSVGGLVQHLRVMESIESVFLGFLQRTLYCEFVYSILTIN